MTHRLFMECIIMKKKLVLATVVAAIMMLGLVGRGVKITNIAVPDAVTK